MPDAIVRKILELTERCGKRADGIYRGSVAIDDYAPFARHDGIAPVISSLAHPLFD